VAFGDRPGVVVDATGAPVPGPTVTADGLDKPWETWFSRRSETGPGRHVRDDRGGDRPTTAAMCCRAFAPGQLFQCHGNARFFCCD